MKKIFIKDTIIKILCLVFGISLSLIGLYFFHKQYLCYEYTPLLFILALVVCLGTQLLSLPLSEKKKNLRAAVTKRITALVLVGGMFLINLIIGNSMLNLIALIVPVYLTFIIITVLALLCINKIFSKKVLKAVFSVLVLIGFLTGSYSYIVPFATDEIYKDYKNPLPAFSTYSDTEDDKTKTK